MISDKISVTWCGTGPSNVKLSCSSPIGTCQLSITMLDMLVHCHTFVQSKLGFSKVPPAVFRRFTAEISNPWQHRVEVWITLPSPCKSYAISIQCTQCGHSIKVPTSQMVQRHQVRKVGYIASHPAQYQAILLYCCAYMLVSIPYAGFHIII